MAQDSKNDRRKLRESTLKSLNGLAKDVFKGNLSLPESGGLRIVCTVYFGFLTPNLPPVHPTQPLGGSFRIRAGRGGGIVLGDGGVGTGKGGGKGVGVGGMGTMNFNHHS